MQCASSTSSKKKIDAIKGGNETKVGKENAGGKKQPAKPKSSGMKFSISMCTNYFIRSVILKSTGVYLTVFLTS